MDILNITPVLKNKNIKNKNIKKIKRNVKKYISFS